MNGNDGSNGTKSGTRTKSAKSHFLVPNLNVDKSIGSRIPSDVDMASATKNMKALILNRAEGKPGQVYHPTEIAAIPIPIPNGDECLVQVLAAAFNHRDLFIRRSMYPGVIFNTAEVPSILGADAVGIVVSPKSHPLYSKHVLLSPSIGWASSPYGPDQPAIPFGILGSVKQTQGRGTFAEFIKLHQDDVVECPAHFLSRGMTGLSEAAACPLGGLTAYRSVAWYFPCSSITAGNLAELTN